MSSPKRLKTDYETMSESDMSDLYKSNKKSLSGHRASAASNSGRTTPVWDDTEASGSVKSIALSGVSYRAGEKILHMSFASLHLASLPISEIIDLRPVPTGLKNAIFKDLAMHVETCCFPNHDQKKDLKSFILLPMLQKIVSSLMRTYKLTIDDLYIDTQADFEIVFKGQTYKGRSNFSVKKELGFEQFNFFLSIECKKDNINEAIFQCIMYLKRMYEIETDKERHYGMCFDGINWFIIRLIKGTIVFSDTYRLLPPSMKREPEEREAEWMKEEGGSEIVDALYSLILEQLIDYNPKVAAAAPAKFELDSLRSAIGSSPPRSPASRYTRVFFSSMLQLLQMISSLFDCSSANTFLQTSDSTLLHRKQTGFSEPSGILTGHWTAAMIVNFIISISARVYCGP